MTQKIYKDPKDIELENNIIQCCYSLSDRYTSLYIVNVLFASINLFAYACKNRRDERTVAAVYGILEFEQKKNTGKNTSECVLKVISFYKT